MNSGIPHFEGFDAEPEETSRSQHKREAQAVRKQIEEIANLGEQSFKSLVLPEDVRAAIVVARKLRPRSDERRRQLQYATKLQRDYPEIDLKVMLSGIGASAKEDPNVMRLEKLRTELIENGVEAVNNLCTLCRDIDRNKLRNLVKKAKDEAGKADEYSEKPASRSLFKFIKQEIKKANIQIPDSLLAKEF